MTQFIIFLIIGVVGIVAGYYFAVSKKIKKNKGLIEKQREEKEINKKRVLEYAKSKGQITNQEAEELLGVSDATSERYLDELEKEGAFKQIGRSGPKVYYKIP